MQTKSPQLNAIKKNDILARKLSKYSLYWWTKSTDRLPRIALRTVTIKPKLFQRLPCFFDGLISVFFLSQQMNLWRKPSSPTDTEL